MVTGKKRTVRSGTGPLGLLAQGELSAFSLQLVAEG